MTANNKGISLFEIVISMFFVSGLAYFTFDMTQLLRKSAADGEEQYHALQVAKSIASIYTSMTPAELYQQLEPDELLGETRDENSLTWLTAWTEAGGTEKNIKKIRVTINARDANNTLLDNDAFDAGGLLQTASALASVNLIIRIDVDYIKREGRAIQTITWEEYIEAKPI